MKSPRLYGSLLLATSLALVFLASARADETSNTIKFSDPAKPGTLKITLGHGSLQVFGADVPEVTVVSDAKNANKAPRKDGLRVLTSASSFALGEKDNVVTLDAVSEGWGRGSSDFKITVPKNTSVIVQDSWGGGDIHCTGVAGDLEIHSMNGQIRLDDIAGGVVVDTMNGEIRANVRELHDKPLSFQSMNGEVVLRLPPDTKANVRLRTQNGVVLTDFPETALVTKTENTPASPFSRRGRTTSPKAKTVIPQEAQDAMREAARATAQAAHETAQAIKEGLDEARVKMESDRKRIDADRMAVEAAAPRAPGEPVKPMPPMPTITGGKLVTGTLNGGGPEISIATMNGDVTLRQIEKK